MDNKLTAEQIKDLLNNHGEEITEIIETTYRDIVTDVKKDDNNE